MLSLNAYILESIISDKVKKDDVNYVGEYDPKVAVKKFDKIRIDKPDGYGIEGELNFDKIEVCPKLTIDCYQIVSKDIDSKDTISTSIFLDKLLEAGLGELYIVTRYYEFKNPQQRSQLTTKKLDLYLGEHGELFNKESDCKKFITYAKRGQLVPKGSGVKPMTILEAKKFLKEGFGKISVGYTRFAVKPY